MDQPTGHPDRQQILELMAAFQDSCVLGAAAELDLFTLLAERPLSLDEVTERLASDRRATAILLDAVAALRLLDKQDDRYAVPDELVPWLMATGAETVLPMLQHRMSILRGWSHLAWIVKSGILPPRTASIRGFEADRAAFVAAMHSVSGPVADELVGSLGPLTFNHLLDVGGASGTWTLAFLRAVPQCKATIFDLPDAIEQARARIAGGDLADRITLVPGDFYADDLPDGADFAWVSAIVHQHSRHHNRDLLGKVFAALVPGGQVGIRDVVMQPCRTKPPFGAMFAVNMLANTATGNTFTFEELAEDLQAAGFVDPQLAVEAEDMDSVVIARKP